MPAFCRHSHRHRGLAAAPPRRRRRCFNSRSGRAAATCPRRVPRGDAAPSRLPPSPRRRGGAVPQRHIVRSLSCRSESARWRKACRSARWQRPPHTCHDRASSTATAASACSGRSLQFAGRMAQPIRGGAGAHQNMRRRSRAQKYGVPPAVSPRSGDWRRLWRQRRPADALAGVAGL